MAVTIKEDVIAGSRIRHNLEGGLVIQRHFKVYGLEATARGSRKQVNALVSPGIPRLTELHPSVGGMFCDDLSIDPITNSPSQANVVATYRDLTAVKIKLDGNVIRENTRIDEDGRVMSVRFKSGSPPGAIIPDTEGDTSTFNADYLRPGMTLEFERWHLFGKGAPTDIPDGSRLDPFELASQFIGTINSQPFQLIREIGVWLCAGISVRETEITGYGKDAPRAAYVAYRFMYKSRRIRGDRIFETWNPCALHINRADRQVPKEVNPQAGLASVGKFGGQEKLEGNGWKIFKIQPPANFEKMKLPVVFPHVPLVQR